METKEYGYAACKFAGRCPYVQDICRQIKPPWVEVDEEVTGENNVKHESLCFKLVDYQNVPSQPEPVA